MKTKNVMQKIVNNPIARIVLGLLVCVGVFIISQNIAAKFLALTGLDKDFRNLFKGIIASIAVIYAVIDRRCITIPYHFSDLLN